MIYLIVHGEVEEAPGRFRSGIVSSSSHDTKAYAQATWDRWISMGLYDPEYETVEFREDAPTLGEVLP